jgi:copper chaperone
MKAAIKVSDISCGHCKTTIENAIKKLQGISYVKADPETKMVNVDFNESIISLDAIKHSIKDSGYDTE